MLPSPYLIGNEREEKLRVTMVYFLTTFILNGVLRIHIPVRNNHMIPMSHPRWFIYRQNSFPLLWLNCIYEMFRCMRGCHLRRLNRTTTNYPVPQPPLALSHQSLSRCYFWHVSISPSHWLQFNVISPQWSSASWQAWWTALITPHLTQLITLPLTAEGMGKPRTDGTQT